MPNIAKKTPVSAILEYLPYRKRGGTAQRDESTYPVFAEAGYVGVRVDHSGVVVNPVSWGVLNLTHRNGNDRPVAMIPDKAEMVEIELNEYGYYFLPGQKMRVALSTNYWPMVVPPPEIVTAKIKPGLNASITLPIRAGRDSIEFPQPENQNSLPVYKNHKPAESKRWLERDLQSGQTRYHLDDDTGEDEMPGHGLRTRHYHRESWSITADDLLSCCASSEYTCWMRRGNWSIRTESISSFRCDAKNYYIKATVAAFDLDKQVNQRQWNKTIKRDLM